MKTIIACFMLVLQMPAFGQAIDKLTLDQCYAMARQNYPMIRQRSLIAKTRDFTVSNAAKGYLPQFSMIGQATYQSDIVTFPVGSPYPALALDQYKVGLELSQTLYDGGAINANQANQQMNADLQEQNLEVTLYSLRDRVSQLFFGILLIQQQTRQLELRKSDLQNGLSKTEAAYINGASFKSNVDELKAEWLNAEENILEYRSNERAYMDMLGLLTNQKITNSSILEEPMDATITDTAVNRPELKLFDLQKKSIDLQENQLKTSYRPKLNVFAQGFYGRPTYNFISNDFGFYGIVGIGLRWPIFNLYTNKNNKMIYALSRQNIDVQRETFLFNTQLTMSREAQATFKFRELMRQDQEIIQLRASVKNAANAQLENGVITSHDYIAKVNDESKARLNQILHKIQLLQAANDLRNSSGN